MGSDMDYKHMMAKSLILCSPHLNSNKYLGVGYKGFVFCRNNGWLIENMDKGLTVHTKTGADKLVENTPNVLKLICRNCLSKPKSLGFWWVPFVHGMRHMKEWNIWNKTLKKGKILLQDLVYLIFEMSGV